MSSNKTQHTPQQQEAADRYRKKDTENEVQFTGLEWNARKAFQEPIVAIGTAGVMGTLFYGMYAMVFKSNNAETQNQMMRGRVGFQLVAVAGLTGGVLLYNLKKKWTGEK